MLYEHIIYDGKNRSKSKVSWIRWSGSGCQQKPLDVNRARGVLTGSRPMFIQVRLFIILGAHLHQWSGIIENFADSSLKHPRRRNFSLTFWCWIKNSIFTLSPSQGVDRMNMEFLIQHQTLAKRTYVLGTLGRGQQNSQWGPWQGTIPQYLLSRSGIFLHKWSRIWQNETSSHSLDHHHHWSSTEIASELSRHGPFRESSGDFSAELPSASLGAIRPCMSSPAPITVMATTKVSDMAPCMLSKVSLLKVDFPMPLRIVHIFFLTNNQHQWLKQRLRGVLTKSLFQLLQMACKPPKQPASMIETETVSAIDVGSWGGPHAICILHYQENQRHGEQRCRREHCHRTRICVLRRLKESWDSWYSWCLKLQTTHCSSLDAVNNTRRTNMSNNVEPCRTKTLRQQNHGDTKLHPELFLNSWLVSWVPQLPDPLPATWNF